MYVGIQNSQNIQYRGKSSLQQLPGGKCNFFVRFFYLLKMHSMHSHWNSCFPTFLQDSSHSYSVYIFSIETRTLKWHLMCSFKLCTVWEGAVIFFTVPNSWIFLLLKQCSSQNKKKKHRAFIMKEFIWGICETTLGKNTLKQCDYSGILVTVWPIISVFNLTTANRNFFSVSLLILVYH